MAKKHNLHHVWFNRSDYRSKPEYEFRNLPYFVVPVLKETHEQLHDEVLPPPKPTVEEMLGCRAYLAAVPHDMRSEPLWAVELSMQYFVYIGAHEPTREPEMHELRHNLAQQIGILSSGLYLGEPKNVRRYARK